MKLPRIWARVVIVLLGGGLFLSALLMFWPPPGQWSILCAIMAAVCIIGALVVDFWKLRCVHCGKSAAPPRWLADKTYRCMHCGKPFEFDD